MKNESMEPDCKTCRKKDECALAVFGMFCPQWQSIEPKPREPDPNEQWRRGDHADI